MRIKDNSKMKKSKNPYKYCKIHKIRHVPSSSPCPLCLQGDIYELHEELKWIGINGKVADCSFGLGWSTQYLFCRLWWIKSFTKMSFKIRGVEK